MALHLAIGPLKTCFGLLMQLQKRQYMKHHTNYHQSTVINMYANVYIGVTIQKLHQLSDDRITRETLSNNNPCPSSPSSTIYIYLIKQDNTCIVLLSSILF